MIYSQSFLYKLVRLEWWIRFSRCLYKAGWESALEVARRVRGKPELSTTADGAVGRRNYKLLR